MPKKNSSKIARSQSRKVSKSQSRKYKKQSFKNMRGGSEWKILDKTFNGRKEFKLKLDSIERINYYIDDNILLYSVVNWMDAEEGPDIERLEVGKLTNGNILEIGPPVTALHTTADTQVEEGTYIIKNVDIPTQQKYVGQKKPTLTIEKISLFQLLVADNQLFVADKEFILYNTKEIIIAYIKNNDNPVNNHSERGRNEFFILKKLNTNYIDKKINDDILDIFVTLLKNDNFVTLLKNITVKKINDDILDNFVTLLKNITGKKIDDDILDNFVTLFLTFLIQT